MTRRWSSSLAVIRSFCRIEATCPSTVRSVRNSRRATPLLRASFGDERQHLSLAGGQRRQRIVAAPAHAEQLRDDLGIQCRATVADATQRVQEIVDIQHPVLEQVAESAGGDQVDGVPALDVLREQHHADFRVVPLHLPGGARTVVGEVRWHPDVDHRQVRKFPFDRHQQGQRVRRLGHHRVPGVLQQPGQTFPEQRGVFPDHDAHGSTACTRVPRAARSRTVNAPPMAATRSVRPARPAPARTAAPPRPLSTPAPPDPCRGGGCRRRSRPRPHV